MYAAQTLVAALSVLGLASTALANPVPEPQTDAALQIAIQLNGVQGGGRVVDITADGQKHGTGDGHKIKSARVTSSRGSCELIGTGITIHAGEGGVTIDPPRVIKEIRCNRIQ